MTNEYCDDDVILITGGSGAIGSQLVRKFIHTEVEKIIVMDNLSSGYKYNLPKIPIKSYS